MCNMGTTLVELRPNRHLLQHEFEGYRLELQSLAHWSAPVAAAERGQPGPDHYSLLHTRLFALHNHLVAEPYSALHLYFVDCEQKVRRVHFDTQTRAITSRTVYDVPAKVPRRPGHYNLCLKFPSNNLAVLSDGTGYLHIVAAENRTSSDLMWTTLHSALALGENIYFVISDCKVQERDDNNVIHCLLQHIEQVEAHFYSVLSWVTFEKVKDEWKQTSKRQLRGKGIVHYAAIENTFKALYIGSDNIFKFIHDTEMVIMEPVSEVPRKIIYTWVQTVEDITVSLKLPTEHTKSLLQVSVTPLSIKVSYAGTIFIEGKFVHRVDSELTTWHLQESGQVDILVTKSEGQMWQDLLDPSDPNGEQIMDPSLVEEAHRKLAHLCSETEQAPDNPVSGLSSQQLEECDVASEEDTTLARFDVTTHEITHKIPLSIHQYLFSVNMQPNEAPALAVRQDVDACIWQPYAKQDTTKDWFIEHRGTLMAFGYVQSSKQNKKFVTCPPNFSYAVVCEMSRHIFIYKSAEANMDYQLRKRSPGATSKQVLVGQQHVFNIDKFGEVIGLHATNTYLFVLTITSLVVIQVV